MSAPGQLFPYCFCELPPQHSESGSLGGVLHVLLTPALIFLYNLDQTLVMGSHLWKGGLFSQMQGSSQSGFLAPRYFVCSWVHTKFCVEFRVMLIYRTCRGVVTHLSSVIVWTLQNRNPSKCAYHGMLMGE